jgi:ubiquitin carboxyl-terminal hydrolase L5
MFNLLAVRSDPIPRLTRQLADTSLPPQQQYTLSDQLEHEQHKAQQGHLENTLRRSNLLPVVFELFKAMGQKGNIGAFYVGPYGRRKGYGRMCTAFVYHGAVSCKGVA